MNRLFIASAITNSLFIYSSVIVYYLCKLLCIPYTNILVTNRNEIITVLPNLIVSTVYSSISVGYVDFESNDYSWTLCKIAIYIHVTEFVYYFMHMALHTKDFPIFSFHLIEHSKQSVYPMDTLYMNLSDFALYMSALNIPVFLVRPSFFEYYSVLLFYFVMLHFRCTNTFFNHHLLHRQNNRYNFCLIFPIFDYMYATYHDRPIKLKTDEVEQDDVDEPCREVEPKSPKKDVDLDDYNHIQNMIEGAVDLILGKEVDDDYEYCVDHTNE